MTLPLILSIISLGLCIAFFFYFRSYIGRKTSADRLLADYRAEVYRLIGEIDAATDRDSLLVEERIKTIKKLLDDTDRRIAVYMRELQRSREGEAMYASLGRGIRAALDSRPSSLDNAAMPAAVPVTTLASLPVEKPSPVQPAVAALLKMENSASSNETVVSKEIASKKRKHKKNAAGEIRGKQGIRVRISEMYTRGSSPAEIASTLGISLAEVDLALNLLQNQAGEK